MLTILDLFSGVGGFSYGLETLCGGFETVAFCECDPFARRVLAKHWPGVRCYDDVRTLTAGRLAADGIAAPDLLCGGFPCQDISYAGRNAGLDGERSGLWHEFARLIGEILPRYVIVENVAALLSRGLDTILGDLAAFGYDAEWHCIPAASVGAPQRRDRVWIVAYPSGARVAGPLIRDIARETGPWRWRGETDLRAVADRPFSSRNRWPAPLLRGVDDGVPRWMDRLRATGNALVPQIPALIGRAILRAEAARAAA